MSLRVLFLCRLLVVLIYMNTVNAQRNTFEAGAAVGFNMAQIDGDRLFGFRRLGVAAGPVININTATRWQVGTGILYSQLGSARGRLDGPGDFDRIRLNFVEVPLIMRFKDWQGERKNKEYFRIAFEGGLTYGRLINWTAISVTGEDITDDQDYEPNAFSINFGATYYISPKWGVHAHWAKQLNNLNNGSDIFVNRYINVLLYYFL